MFLQINSLVDIAYTFLDDLDEGDDSMGQSSESLKKQSLDTKMRAMMKEILFYSFFIFLLVFVVNGNQDENVFWQNQDLRNRFEFTSTDEVCTFPFCFILHIKNLQVVTATSISLF